MKPAIAATRRHVASIVFLLLILAAFPCSAEAHGPADPVATGYLARIRRIPAGLDAKVVDGYLRMWLRVPPGKTVEVLDYRGVPYLRFTSSGVYVNERSEMYYLNHTMPLNPPGYLSRSTPPRWRQLSTGDEYTWHDGRLGGLADVALQPGASYVGRWTIPVRIDGRLRQISGGLWHAANPSIAWFWPIVVALACMLAAFRLRRTALDASLSRALALIAAIAVAVGAAGRELHGRPGISALQLLVLSLALLLASWVAVTAMRRRRGALPLFAIAVAAALVGLELLPTLLHGFVLIALPSFLARTTAVVCLAVSPALVLLALRRADEVQ